MEFSSKRVFLLSYVTLYQIMLKDINQIRKRIKLFEHFKLVPSSVLFAQETHSTKEIEQKWKDELNGQTFFSHGKSNSCGVFIALLAVNQ